MGLNELSNNLNINRGQNSVFSNATQGNKILYLAKVIDVSDFSNMGRIQAEIIDFDDNTGQEKAGKDKNDNFPKFAFPLLPHFFNSIPKIDELVYIFLENPKDQSSRRFYVGPIRSAKSAKGDFESASSANNIFTINSFQGNNTLLPTNSKPTEINQDHIYIRGKDDSDIIFKSREVLLRAGSLVDGTFNPNNKTNCFVQLIQKNENTEPNTSFSQVNIVGSNINLISSDSSTRQNRVLNENGKLKDEKNVEFNTNPRLEDYGDDAKKLHPLVLGDELVKVLKVLIRFCLNHKHTPQDKAYAPTEEIGILNDFLSDENIQCILSKSVRTN